MNEKFIFFTTCILLPVSVNAKQLISEPGKLRLFELKKAQLPKGSMVFVLLILFLQLLSIKAGAISDPWQFTLSSGFHSFYAPVENLKWDNPGLVVSGGINRLLGKRQQFSAGLHLAYMQNKYQGDATSLQLLGQFLPVIKNKVEIGIGTGAGYRFSGYPSSSLKWNGSSWEDNISFKRIIQIPLQISAGFRSISIARVSVIPFAAYQMQALFNYNPDFVPLPESSLMFGFKFKY